MYFKNIEIENVGPIEHIKLEFPKVDDHPKPIIIVGENGAGKSILLSHLVNSLIVGKQEVFDDLEVDQGRVYKLRSPNYIKSGKDYSYSSVKFESGIEIEECQLKIAKNEFEKNFSYTPARKIWNRFPQTENSVFLSTFGNYAEATSNLFKNQCCLYFPLYCKQDIFIFYIQWLIFLLIGNTMKNTMLRKGLTIF